VSHTDNQILVNAHSYAKNLLAVDDSLSSRISSDMPKSINSAKRAVHPCINSTPLRAKVTMQACISPRQVLMAIILLQGDMGTIITTLSHLMLNPTLNRTSMRSRDPATRVRGHMIRDSKRRTSWMKTRWRRMESDFYLDSREQARLLHAGRKLCTTNCSIS
jgi:hypothetical protein